MLLAQKTNAETGASGGLDKKKNDKKLNSKNGKKTDETSAEKKKEEVGRGRIKGGKRAKVAGTAAEEEAEVGAPTRSRSKQVAQKRNDGELEEEIKGGSSVGGVKKAAKPKAAPKPKRKGMTADATPPAATTSKKASSKKPSAAPVRSSVKRKR
jgi:hypothetical protein